MAKKTSMSKGPDDGGNNDDDKDLRRRQAKPAGVDARVLATVIGEMTRKGDDIAEATSDLGNYVKNAIKANGLDQGALRVIKKAAKMETAKRQSFLSAIIDYAWKMGHFSQLSLFDDVSTVMRTIIADVDREKGGDAPTHEAAAAAGDDGNIVSRLVN